jgi:hypothetical protein
VREVDVHDAMCWVCKGKLERANSNRLVGRRITMRGWLVVLAGVVFFAMLGLMAMARLAH